MCRSAISRRRVFQVCHAWLTSSELRTSVQFADATAAFSSCWLALDQHQTCLREATSYLGVVWMDPTIDRWSEFPSGWRLRVCVRGMLVDTRSRQDLSWSAHRFVGKWFSCSRLNREKSWCRFSPASSVVSPPYQQELRALKSPARRVQCSCRRLVRLRHRSRLERNGSIGLFGGR